MSVRPAVPAASVSSRRAASDQSPFWKKKAAWAASAEPWGFPAAGEGPKASRRTISHFASALPRRPGSPDTSTARFSGSRKGTARLVRRAAVSAA
jgi:hypothetical protein